jgi:transcriptional regulator with XRE-family HTH domain
MNISENLTTKQKRFNKEICNSIGIKPKRLHRIESGKVSPTLEEVQKICDYFAIGLEGLDFVSDNIKNSLL